VVVIVTFVAVELNNAYSPASISSPSPSQAAVSVQSSASSSNSTTGLQLKLILDSTSIKTGGAITAQIEVVNTLDHNLTLASAPAFNQTVPALNGTMLSLNNYDYVCSENPTYFVADFVLFKGSLKTVTIGEVPPMIIGLGSSTILAQDGSAHRLQHQTQLQGPTQTDSRCTPKRLSSEHNIRLRIWC
jgi:hypothetical protein